MRMYASFPSGVQVGEWSKEAWELSHWLLHVSGSSANGCVTCRAPVPSAFITKIALCSSPKLSGTGALYASCVPSGDQAGGLGIASAVLCMSLVATVASGPCSATRAARTRAGMTGILLARWHPPHRGIP